MQYNYTKSRNGFQFCTTQHAGAVGSHQYLLSHNNLHRYFTRSKYNLIYSNCNIYLIIITILIMIIVIPKCFIQIYLIHSFLTIERASYVLCMLERTGCTDIQETHKCWPICPLFNLWRFMCALIYWCRTGRNVVLTGWCVGNPATIPVHCLLLETLQLLLCL